MASGDTLLVFTATDARPPAANAATLDLLNEHPVLDFDAGATNEGAYFEGIMPQAYADTTGVTIHYIYTMSSAVTNDIIMQASWDRLEEDARADTNTFTTPIATAADTVPITTAGKLGYVSKAFAKGATEMQSVVAGDYFRLFVERNSNSASDDATGDLELHAVEIRET